MSVQSCTRAGQSLPLCFLHYTDPKLTITEYMIFRCILYCKLIDAIVEETRLEQHERLNCLCKKHILLLTYKFIETVEWKLCNLQRFC